MELSDIGAVSAWVGPAPGAAQARANRSAEEVDGGQSIHADVIRVPCQAGALDRLLRGVIGVLAQRDDIEA